MALEFFGQFFPAILSEFILPLHQDSAGFIADEGAFPLVKRADRRQPFRAQGLMQEEFDFDSTEPRPDGVAAWRRARQERLAEIARANGLPLGFRCRVELAGDVVLEGVLRLADDDLVVSESVRNLNLKLQIDRCEFSPREIQSVVRLD